MNAGILTFHMAHNCGAMLQTFALCRYINGTGSINCEVIDYRLKEIYEKYEQMMRMDLVEPRRRNFDNYMNNYLPLSERIYKLSEAKTYDLYIIGSDQIWNSDITIGYRDEYFAKNFPDNSFCISYAASTGKLVDNPKEFVEKLSSFRYIGVRELSLKKQLSPFLKKEITWCLDPVLLLEPKEWNRSSEKMPLCNYILIYSFFLSEREYQEIIRFAFERRLPVIELVTHSRTMLNSITYIDDYGPEKWLEYMQNAKYIFTDSYHGVLFSFIFNKGVYLQNRTLTSNVRIKDVLNRLMLRKDDDGFYRASEYTKDCLIKGRSESVDFLSKVFNEVKKNADI